MNKGNKTSRNDNQEYQENEAVGTSLVIKLQMGLSVFGWAGHYWIGPGFADGLIILSILSYFNSDSLPHYRPDGFSFVCELRRE